MHPAICMLALLGVIPCPTRSWIASVMLLAQSPVTRKAVAGVAQRGGHKGAGDASERVSYVIDLPFVSAKEKDFVFDNRAADAAAVLFQCS